MISLCTCNSSTQVIAPGLVKIHRGHTKANFYAKSTAGALTTGIVRYRLNSKVFLAWSE